MKYITMHTKPDQVEQAIENNFLPAVQPRSLKVEDIDQIKTVLNGRPCCLALQPVNKADYPLNSTVTDNRDNFVKLIRKYNIYAQRLSGLNIEMVTVEAEWRDFRNWDHDKARELNEWNTSIIKEFWNVPVALYFRSLQAYYINYTEYKPDWSVYWNGGEDLDFLTPSLYDPTTPQAEIMSLRETATYDPLADKPLVVYVGFRWKSLGGTGEIDYPPTLEYQRGFMIAKYKPEYIGIWTKPGVDFEDDLFMKHFVQFNKGYQDGLI